MNWLLLGCCHQSIQNDKYFFNTIGNALDKCSQNYKKFLTDLLNAKVTKLSVSQSVLWLSLKV